jgi:alpha-ketoglutarate-dependent taurine dioxygenase
VKGLGLRAERLHTVGGQATGLVVRREASETLLELPREELLAAFREHGVLVFRGFPVDAAVFDAFTRRFADRFVIHANSTQLRKPPERDVTIGTVDSGNAALPPHAELAFLPRPFRPDICFFHGVTPAPVGGATMVYDGQAIVRALPLEIRQTLAVSRLRFRIPVPREAWTQVLEIDSPHDLARVTGDFRIAVGGFRARATRSVLRFASWAIGRVTRKDLSALDRADPLFRLAAFACGPDAQAGSIHVEWETPVLTRSRFSGEEALATTLFSGYMRRYGRLNGRRISRHRDLVSRVLSTVERHRAPIQWSSGDVIMIDNTRMMHGRGSFEDAVGQRRHVRTRFGLVSDAGESNRASTALTAE